jgi:predicted phage terminase large subunit-like protein
MPAPDGLGRIAAHYRVEASKRAMGHLDFVRSVWNHSEPFVVGRHTRVICDRIDRAITEYREGRSTFLVVTVPFRHGKSELLSRTLPPHWLGLFPSTEVLLATYGQDLATTLSRSARTIVNGEAFRAWAPDVEVSSESAAAARWSIEGRGGLMSAVGFGGGMSGRGYALGLVDDFFKNKDQAESQSTRNLVWESFRNDFLTRRAPVAVTIVLTTRWGKDDPVGRLQKAMAADEKFPHFEVIKFPAMDDAYPGGVLFPERFPREWYEAQKATLGSVGFACLMQQEPVAVTGNLFRVDRVKTIKKASVPSGLRWVRCWDVASSTKQVAKDDPDYTAGVLMATVQRPRANGLPPEPVVYVATSYRGRWEAPERDRRIRAVAETDGRGVRIGLECVAGYKDTLTRFRELFKGTRTVQPIVPTTDKVVRWEPLMAVVEAGNFYVVEGDWNAEYLDEMAEAPHGTHDDQLDATAGGYFMGQGTASVRPADEGDLKPVTAGFREARW